MNDELTPEERAALRARIVGGARGITPVGAHRGAWIAGSIAAVLVVAIAGGVVATSTLSAPPVATTPSPSPSLTPTTEPTRTFTPTPTLTPTPVPVGIAPFAGACDNVADPGILANATGYDMYLAGSSWSSGIETVRGGLTCVWASRGEYLAALLSVSVFPEGVERPTTRPLAEPGCDLVDRITCVRIATVNAMTVRVEMSAPLDVVERGSKEMLDAAVSRIGDYPVGVAATPTGDWWAPLLCEDLVAAFDAPALGADSVTVKPAEFSSIPNDCDIAFFFGDTRWTASAHVVPGGAVDLPTVPAAGGEAVEVAGAETAYWVSTSDGIDGGGGRSLVASDGTNVLVVYVAAHGGDLDLDLQRAVAVAERVLRTV